METSNLGLAGGVFRKSMGFISHLRPLTLEIDAVLENLGDKKHAHTLHSQPDCIWNLVQVYETCIALKRKCTVTEPLCIIFFFF